jgi:hypothetical protein
MTLRELLYTALHALEAEPHSVSNPWTREQAIKRADARVELRRALEILDQERGADVAPTEAGGPMVGVARDWILVHGGKRS